MIVASKISRVANSYLLLSVPPSTLPNCCARVSLIFLIQCKGHFLDLPRRSRNNLWIPYREPIIKAWFVYLFINMFECFQLLGRCYKLLSVQVIHDQRSLNYSVSGENSAIYMTFVKEVL